MTAIPFITPSALFSLIGTPQAPVIIDGRRPPAFNQDNQRLPGARRGHPERIDDWKASLPPGPIVVYCVHGHEVSQGITADLIAAGRDARYLEGGIEDGWKQAGYPTIRRTAPLKENYTGSLWITRERPKIDRLACPWLIRRFIDPEATFFYAPPGDVMQLAQKTSAIPFDIPGADISHDGPACSFDALIKTFGIVEQSLDRLALIIRGADTNSLGIAAEAAGLLAISLGLSRIIRDDQTLLQTSLQLYDGLYAWCREGQSETHHWPPKIQANASVGSH